MRLEKLKRIEQLPRIRHPIHQRNRNQGPIKAKNSKTT